MVVLIVSTEALVELAYCRSDLQRSRVHTRAELLICNAAGGPHAAHVFAHPALPDGASSRSIHGWHGPAATIVGPQPSQPPDSAAGTAASLGLCGHAAGPSGVKHAYKRPCVCIRADVQSCISGMLHPWWCDTETRCSGRRACHAGRSACLAPAYLFSGRLLTCCCAYRVIVLPVGHADPLLRTLPCRAGLERSAARFPESGRAAARRRGNGQPGLQPRVWHGLLAESR